MFFEVLVSLLSKHGVAIHDVNVAETGEVKIDIDFSEHDKVFEDKIEKLEKINKQLEVTNKNLGGRLDVLRTRCKDSAVDMFDNNCYGCLSIVTHPRENELEVKSLKQRIADLESNETEKSTKINLNDRIKVKLTPLGAEIYYNRYNFLKSSIRAIGGVCSEPKMPKIDENGYTEMTMWQFVELYGKDIGKINREVIKPLDIIISE